MVKNLASKRENWYTRAVYVSGAKIIESNPAYKGMEWRFRSTLRFGHFEVEVLAHTAEDCAEAIVFLKEEQRVNPTVLPTLIPPGFYNAGFVAGSFVNRTYRQEV